MYLLYLNFPDLSQESFIKPARIMGVGSLPSKIKSVCRVGRYYEGTFLTLQTVFQIFLLMPTYLFYTVADIAVLSFGGMSLLRSINSARFIKSLKTSKSSP